VRWLPVITALFLTPSLTLATRSPVGGAVLTVGLGGLLMVAGEWIGIAKYGYSRNVDTFRVSFLWTALPLLSAAAAGLLWWTFPRLQVVDGRGDTVDLVPDSRPTSPSLTRRHPIWLLIRKELRLQQLAVAIAAIYVVAFIAIVLRTRGFFYDKEVAFGMSMLYAGLLTAVIGSMASAEERHLGVIDAQLLLPMRTSQQWLVKVAVVIGLTFVLSILLPAALTIAFHPGRIPWGRDLPTVAGFTIVALISVSAVCLYVSTLSSSGIWALVMSVPAGFAVATVVMKLDGVTQGALYSLDGRPDWAIVRWASVIVTVAVIGLVLRLALANHRSADRSRSRIAGQVGIAAAASVAASVIVVVVGALSR
jgi:hypothetical protein